MGLIKRDQLEEKGILLIEKPAVSVPHREAPPKVVRPAAVRVAADDLPRAKSEAERIVDQALQEAEQIREGAREEGRHEGRDEAAARIEEALETVNEAVKERKRIIKDSEAELLRLSLKIAEQIIRSEVSLHRDVSLNIVSEAIGRVSDREQIIVRVNREDAEYLKRYKDRLAGMLDGVKSFSIIEDSNIEPGGCVIETNLGFIDARIATKLRSIEEALQKVSGEETN
ncbi:MAG: FliH/SctL family protein [Candidatus Margulisiibacteriota bacterium]